MSPPDRIPVWVCPEHGPTLTAYMWDGPDMPEVCTGMNCRKQLTAVEYMPVPEGTALKCSSAPVAEPLRALRAEARMVLHQTGALDYRERVEALSLAIEWAESLAATSSQGETK